LSVLHLVYGLRIEVDVPLPGLPVQPGTQAVDVRVRLNDESVIPPATPTSSDKVLYNSSNLDEKGHTTLQVVMLGGGTSYGFFYSDGARFTVDSMGRNVFAYWPENYTLEDACTYLLGPVIAFALQLRGVTCLHASAIVVDGRAIALFGVAGVGKSTTAAAFALRGYSVLSDDVAVLADLGDRFLVQPGYPRLNLWPDSVRTLFGSEDVLPRITPTWDKRYLALDQNGRRFQSSPLPLGAIYILGEHEAELTAPVIEEVVGSEAIMTLVSNTYVNYLLDRDMRAREFDVLSRLLAGVPVRRVRPAADTSKVFALCESITADATHLALPEATRAELGAH
jgi:hypothetical protein